MATGGESTYLSNPAESSGRQTLQLLDRIQRDEHLNPRHISLLLALLWAWQKSNFIGSFRVSRKALMQAGRIASTATYHKTIRELVASGYIDYESSFHPKEGSRVQFV